MRRSPLGLALAAVCWPAGAFALPIVSITSPAPATCVGSGLPVQEAAPGGAPLPANTDITLRVDLANPGPVTLRVMVDGRVVSEHPQAPGDGLVVTVPGFELEDGQRRLGVVAEDSQGRIAEAEVAVLVDRAPPTVRFDPEALAALGACVQGDAPPAVAYEVQDAADPNPQVIETVESNGCLLERVITTVDACHNGLRVRVPAQRAPAQPLRVVIEGVEEGARVFDAVLSYQIQGPAGCATGVVATLQRDGGELGPFAPGHRVDVRGDYVAEVVVSTCGGGRTSADRRFTIVGRPRASAGGPYTAPQGGVLIVSAAASVVPAEAGAITGYAWDLNGDGFFDADEGRAVEVPFNTLQEQGRYPIGVRVRTAGGFEDFAYSEVVLTDVVPTCDAGGPYRIEQGLLLEVDGTGSAPGHELEPILVYDWDFGDSRFPQRGLAPVGTHRYVNEGDYTVTLTVEDQDSQCQDQAAVTVVDVEPVIRNLGVEDADHLVEGDTVVFSAGQTSAGSDAEPLTELAWDFGDGSDPLVGLEVRGPSHTYDDSGEFRVCLEVSDVDSTAQECFPLVVADLQPQARLSGPGFAVEGRSVTFDALGSRAGGPADPLDRYVWDFGDGSAPVEVRDLGQTAVDHVFQRNGDLTVRLQVWDEDSFAEATRRVVVDDARPTAALELPSLTVGEGVAVRLDASGSVAGSESDPIVLWRWDFGDGTTDEGPELSVVEHRWPDQGVYGVRVVVVDADGSESAAERFINARNLPPSEVDIEGPAEVEVGQELSFRVHYSDVEADVARISWRSGDGGTADSGDTFTYSYAVTGTYTVRVRVDDGDGGVAEAQRDVVVTGAAPSVEAPTVVEGREGEPMQVDIIVRSAPDGEGGTDGPVDVTVPSAPTGATVEFLDGEEDPTLRRDLRVRWTPGMTDAGQHLIRIVAEAPSGLRRVHEVRLEVADGGQIRLVGAAGRVVEIYAYDVDRRRRVGTFAPVAVRPVGGAIAALVAAEGVAFAATPSRGSVAVVDLGSGALVRRIPVRGRPGALVLGGGLLWVGDVDGEWLSAVDPVRLKVRGHRRLGARTPMADLAWVSGAVAGGEDRLVLAGRGGRLVSVVAASVLDAEVEPVMQARTLGGELRRVLSVGDRLHVVRLRPSGVVTVRADRLDGEALEPEAEPLRVVPTPFLARDLGVDGDRLWLATARGLEEVSADGRLSVRLRGAVSSVAVLPESLFGVPVLSVGAARRVVNLSVTELDEVSSARSGGPQRLVAVEVRR